jgi:hypothetical protein
MSTFTLVHVVISLIGILSGFVIVFGLIAGKRLDNWTAVFLSSTILTSVTGYFFPVHKLTPGHIIGAISLVLLAVCVYARYARALAGGWRLTYVVTAVFAFYLNFFVLIVQMFMKVPALHGLAPTQTEGPFKLAQLFALVLFLLFGIAASRKFHPELAPST